MHPPRVQRALLVLAFLALLTGGRGTNVAAQDGGSIAGFDSIVAQVVVNTAAVDRIGPARNWGNVASNYRYYYGPNHVYDAGWYATRHLGYPNNYVAYASDPADVCSTEYYYMPDDGVYYCYTPDPVAMNSSLQGRCPDQPYLYICPD